MRTAPAAVGAALAAVDTPALIVQEDCLLENMEMLQTLLKDSNVSIRPHVKTHKCPEIAALQLEQHGTSGICCQKVSEAVAMADVAGDVLLSSQVASPTKARRLAALARRGCNVTAVVDTSFAARLLAEAARDEGTRLGVLIDVNVGQDRCGVDSPEEAVTLAREIKELQELSLRGIQAYQGKAQHIRSWEQRCHAAAEAADKARAVKDALVEANFECGVVSGGGTGTCEIDAASGVFTEVQPGSYIFNDVDYSKNLDHEGNLTRLWKQSLFVASTVISCNRDARRLVLDAGLKAVAFDSGEPRIRGWPESLAQVECGGDEHTVVKVSEGAALPALGEQILLVPGHCDPTVNLHEYLLAVKGGTVNQVWAIAGRGPGL